MVNPRISQQIWDSLDKPFATERLGKISWCTLTQTLNEKKFLKTRIKTNLTPGPRAPPPKKKIPNKVKSLALGKLCQTADKKLDQRRKQGRGGGAVAPQE